MPAILHLPACLAAGFLGGALWGGIPGYLRARFGSHEVINTIMLNYVAFYLINYLILGPLHGPGDIPQTAYIYDSAQLPNLLAKTRLHAGFLLAVGVAAATWFLLYKTAIGLALRVVGANPDAAQNAGHPVKRYVVGALALAGGLAGFAGACEVLGVNHRLPDQFSSGYGFDAIAIALLGRSHPVGVLAAALLFGALRNGASLMQLQSGVSAHLISVIQALVIFFLASGPLMTMLLARRPFPAGAAGKGLRAG
jgi:simple sugar transport system permease protein